MTAEAILQILIETMNLAEIARQEPNSFSRREGISIIETFLADQEYHFSDTIYVPGGAGVVRVCLEKTGSGIKAQSVGFTPEGASSEFFIPFDEGDKE